MPKVAAERMVEGMAGFLSASGIQKGNKNYASAGFLGWRGGNKGWSVTYWGCGCHLGYTIGDTQLISSLLCSHIDLLDSEGKREACQGIIFQKYK
jgi:hypothetical protein